jgi:hypothetical protein
VRGRAQLFDVGFASSAGMAAMELRGSETQRQRAARAGSDSNGGDGCNCACTGDALLELGESLRRPAAMTR